MSVLRRRRYPFTLSPLPAGALTASAGDDQSLGVGVTTATLVGSAAGGQGPYTYEWSRVSGGAATFGSANSATTTAELSASAVLRLTVHDATRTVATDDVDVTMPPTFFLDTLSTQPLWAHWLGGRLRTGQTNVLRVRRSTGGEQDIGLVDDMVDLAALADFCGAGVGYLVTPYNAVDNAYVDMPAPSTGEQAIIYSFAPLGEVADGVVHVTGPVLGANGYLAAYFDGGVSDPDPGIGVETGDDIYLRSDALGMSGNANITLACDAHTKNLGWQALSPMSIGKHLTIEDSNYSQFIVYIDLFPPYENFDYELVLWPPSGTANLYDENTAYPLAGWLQATHTSGLDISGFTFRINGAAQAVSTPLGPGNLLNMVAPLYVSWGGYPRYAAYDYSDTIPGISSAFFAWNALLSSNAADQAAFDAWQLARHA